MSGGGGGGVCGQNICYHVAAYVILFNLLCSMLKKLNSDLIPWGGGGGGGSVGKLFATMLLHSKLSFDLLTPRQGKFWPRGII